MNRDLVKAQLRTILSAAAVLEQAVEDEPSPVDRDAVRAGLVFLDTIRASARGFGTRHGLDHDELDPAPTSVSLHVLWEFYGGECGHGVGYEKDCPDCPPGLNGVRSALRRTAEE